MAASWVSQNVIRILPSANRVHIEGYEKAFYDRLEQQKQVERDRLLNSPSPSDIEILPPSTEKKKLTRIILRGQWGECKLRVADFVTAHALLMGFCERQGKHGSMVRKLKLSFDGDTIDPTAIVSEMGIEDDDVMDVILS